MERVPGSFAVIAKDIARAPAPGTALVLDRLKESACRVNACCWTLGYTVPVARRRWCQLEIAIDPKRRESALIGPVFILEHCLEALLKDL